MGHGHHIVSFESEQDSKEDPSHSFIIKIIHLKNLFLFSVNVAVVSGQCIPGPKI